MSRNAVMAVQGAFQHAFSMVERYLDVCPDDIWAETNGGWPVWQQMYHAVNALYFFVNAPDEAFPEPPIDADAGRLGRVCTETLSKETVKGVAVAAKARVERYIAALEDVDLSAKNLGLSQRMGMDMLHGTTLAMLASHTLYHVGSCDAALRDHGMNGVF